MQIEIRSNTDSQSCQSPFLHRQQHLSVEETKECNRRDDDARTTPRAALPAQRFIFPPNDADPTASNGSQCESGSSNQLDSDHETEEQKSNESSKLDGRDTIMEANQTSFCDSDSEPSSEKIVSVLHSKNNSVRESMENGQSQTQERQVDDEPL